MRRILPVLLISMMVLAGCTAANNGTVRRRGAVRPPITDGARKARAQVSEPQKKFFVEIGVAGKRSADGQTYSGDMSGGSVFDDTTLSVLKREVFLKPGKWTGHYNLGLFYMSRGEFEAAEKSLHKAMEHKGSPRMIYNALGTLYESMGNQDKAVDLFKSAQDVKKTPLVMMNFANTYMRMGVMEKAEKYYRKADGSDISSMPVFNYNMALMLYKTGQYGEALEHIDKTVSGGREDYLIRYTRASVLVKLNRYEEAIVIFGQLKAERPGDARLYKNMGVIYELYTGDMARALQNYVGYIGIVGEDNAGDVSLWADVVRARISRQGGSATGQGGSATGQGGSQ